MNRRTATMLVVRQDGLQRLWGRTEINSRMTKQTEQPDLYPYRWQVEFSFRCTNEHQRKVLEDLGIIAHETVRQWIEIIIPGAYVLEPSGTPIRRVFFLSRAGARRFRQTWGGRIVPT